MAAAQFEAAVKPRGALLLRDKLGLKYVVVNKEIEKELTIIVVGLLLLTFYNFVVQFNHSLLYGILTVPSKVQPQEVPPPSLYIIWPTIIFFSFVDFGSRRTQILFVVLGYTIQSMPPRCVSY